MRWFQFHEQRILLPFVISGSLSARYLHTMGSGTSSFNRRRDLRLSTVVYRGLTQRSTAIFSGLPRSTAVYRGIRLSTVVYRGLQSQREVEFCLRPAKKRVSEVSCKEEGNPTEEVNSTTLNPEHSLLVALPVGGNTRKQQMYSS